MDWKEQFKKLFDPSDVISGRTIHGSQNDPTKKNKGKSWTKGPGEITEDDWNKHFEGKTNLGLSPIKSNQKCKWAAIDIDIYPFDIVAFSKKYQDCPFFFCKTKSGGQHVYIFFNRDRKATEVRKFMNELSALMGFPGVEVFPKQDTVSVEENRGNWINAPYFGGDTTKQYCVYNGVELAPETFIKTAIKSKVVDFDEILNKFKLSSAPPCIQKMFANEIQEGHRDVSLMNLGVFLKQKFPEDWESKIHWYNENSLSKPLSEKEVQQSIISQLKRKNIFYQCKSTLADYCDKSLCLTREFGLSSNNNPETLMGLLEKLDTDPPIWYLEIDSIKMELTTDELMDQRRFRKACVEAIGKIPSFIKPEDWDRIIQDKLDSMIIIEAPEDASTDGTFYHLLKQFCLERSGTKQLGDVLRRRVYNDSETKENYFRGPDLLDYLQKKKFTDFKTSKVYARIKLIEGQAVRKRIDGSTIRLWSLPFYEEQSVESANREILEVPDFEDTEMEDF